MNKLVRFLQTNGVYPKQWSRLMTKTAAINVVSAWKRKFEEEKIDDSDFSLKCILSHVLNVDFSSIQNFTKHQLDDSQKEHFEKLCECRLSHMPIQYVIGYWDFRNIVLRMIPPVFIPRPETEQIVELVLKNVNETGDPLFLEVGCGTGAISCSILYELLDAKGVAIDCSRLACSLTRFNAKELDVLDRLNIVHHKVTENAVLPPEIDQKFDFIVSNPPYVRTGDILKLAPEIKLYEDLRALDGGPDGLKVIRHLCRIATQSLKVDGTMWLEVDCSQTNVISELVEKNFPRSLEFISSYTDLYGRERFVEIRKRKIWDLQ